MNITNNKSVTIRLDTKLFEILQSNTKRLGYKYNSDFITEAIKDKLVGLKEKLNSTDEEKINMKLSESMEHNSRMLAKALKNESKLQQISKLFDKLVKLKKECFNKYRTSKNKLERQHNFNLVLLRINALIDENYDLNNEQVKYFIEQLKELKEIVENYLQTNDITRLAEFCNMEQHGT